MLSRRPPTATRGFTLVEVVIVMAMAALLAGAAVPALQGALLKGRRPDAFNALTAVQLAQERWRAEHANYTSALSELGLPDTVHGGRYTLRVTAADADGFTVEASANGAQQRDTDCAVLRVVVTGGAIRHEAVDGTGTGSEAQGRRCWLQ